LSSVVSPLNQTICGKIEEVVYAKADSGASDHYIRKQDSDILSNLRPITSKPITIPNGSTIRATQSGMLPFAAELSEYARRAKILPELKSASLVSLGKLCDDGCDIHLNASRMQVFKNARLILEGLRNNDDGLYDIPISKVKLQANNYIQPPIHPSIYCARQRQYAEEKEQASAKTGISIKPRVNLLSKAFKGIFKLAEHNECDNLITKQA